MTMSPEQSHLLAYLKHTPGFENRIPELQDMPLEAILEQVEAADPEVHRRWLEEAGSGQEQAGAPDPMEQYCSDLTEIRDRTAGKILNWTMPYLSGAGGEMMELAEPERGIQEGVMEHLARVESAVMDWNRRNREQGQAELPESWSRIGDWRSITRCSTGNMMVAQFEEPGSYWHLTDGSMTTEGQSEDTLAGVEEIQSIRLECVTQAIEDDEQYPDTPPDGIMGHLHPQYRIERLLEIAEGIMGIGHTGITGAAIHAMATQEGTTEAEPPHPDILARAANLMAFAGAIAGATVNIINEILWQIYDQDEPDETKQNQREAREA